MNFFTRWLATTGLMRMNISKSAKTGYPRMPLSKLRATLEKIPRTQLHGQLVRRGPSWAWNDQDGGPDRNDMCRGEETPIGKVTRSTEDPGWLQVMWPNGHRNSYRYDSESKCFDVVPVSLDSASNPPKPGFLVRMNDATIATVVESSRRRIKTVDAGGREREFKSVEMFHRAHVDMLDPEEAEAEAEVPKLP